MAKKAFNSGKFLLALIMALALLLSGGAARAAEETTQQTPIWTDNSLTKYLLSNYAFYELSEQALTAKDAPAMIEALQKTDPWAQYYTPEQYPAVVSMIDGDFVGIGVYLQEDDNGRVTIAGSIAGSPAERAGLKNGDIIVSVDGTNTRNASLDELIEVLTGEENSLLTLVYERDGRTTELLMNRKRIILPSIEYWLLEDDVVAYMLVEQFTSHTAEEMKAGIASLKKQGMKALVVDLRNCPGGLLDSAVEVCGQLTSSEEPMVFFVSKYGWEALSPQNTIGQLDLPLAVLVNGNTASAAELLAANVQDVNSGVLIGEPSYGKGVVQQMIELPSGAGISFTTGKYLSHGYQDIDLQGGVLPDFYVTGEEEQRAKAVAWAKGQLAQPTSIKYYVGRGGYALGETWQDGTVTLLMQEGLAYVPLTLTLTNMGWQIEERDGLLYANLDGQRLIIDVAQQILITGKGEHRLLMRDGLLYLPATLLSQYNHSVTWNSNENSIIIEK